MGVKNPNVCAKTHRECAKTPSAATNLGVWAKKIMMVCKQIWVGVKSFAWLCKSTVFGLPLIDKNHKRAKKIFNILYVILVFC